MGQFALQTALEKAKARTKEIEARKDLDRPRRDVDWKDIGKSALTGARSGLESTVGGIGDIGALQKDATLWLADRAGISARAASPHAVEHERSDTGERGGLSPEAMDFISTYTNPMSLAPTSEDIGAATDTLTGRDDYTRHVSTTPQGQNVNTAANFASGLVGGPENLAKDLGVKAATVAPHLIGAGGAKLATLIGPMSKLWNKEMASLAESMWNAGKMTGKAEPEILDDIWKATGTDTLAGTTRSKGGHFQQEISDADARMANPLWGERGDPTTMGGAMEHPLGFEAYPDLTTMPVEGRNYGNLTTQGSYRSGDQGALGEVGVNTSLPPDEQKSVLLHEGFGHGVQEKEGWEKGATNKMFGGPEDPAWDVYKKRTKAVNTPMTREAFYAEGGPGSRGDYSYEDYLKQAKASMKGGMGSTIDKIVQQEALNEAYFKNAAEAQSRNIQKRQDMPLDELKQQPFHRDFDVPLEQQLVKKRPEAEPANMFEVPGKKISPKRQARLDARKARSGRDELSELMPKEEVVAPHAGSDPKNKYSKLVANKPPNEVTAGYENTAPLLPKKPFSPEQMEIGSNVLGIMGDRSVAGRRLMSIEGQPLTQGVDLRGGEGFTRGEAQQSYGAGWANEAGPAGALQNKINSNADRPTYLWYLPMSEQSIDASRHVSRPTLDLLAQAEPGRKAIEDFIPRLQKGIENEGGLDIAPSLGGRQKVADWLLGLKDWSETSSMKGRRALAQSMDTAKSRNSLGVDVGQVRLAATDPDLVNANTFEAGHSILRAEPGGSLIKDPMLNHPDYGTQIPAVYQGRTENPVPYEDLFDEWARAREAKKPGERESERAYTFRLANPTQPVTQELIDRLMARQEMVRRIVGSGGSR